MSDAGEPRGRAVAKILETTMRDGQSPGHRVRVVLEPGNWTELDPFLALMEDWVSAGTFGPHPHRGFETVTYVLEGELQHRDNRGGAGVLKEGDAQLMTAGAGIIHEEEPSSASVHTLQLWLNLPAATKMTEPRYQDLRAESMPVRCADGIEIRVFSGHSGEEAAPTLNHVPFTMLDIRMEPGSAVMQDSSPEETAFIYVIQGSGLFGSERTSASAGQVVWFAPSAEAEEPYIRMHAVEYMHAVYFAARPLRESVAARGPFVMKTDDEIRQAYEDYRVGRFD